MEYRNYLSLMIKSSISLFLFLLPVFLCSGCLSLEIADGDADAEEEIPVSRRRTVLVYLGVDNNFSGEAATKIETLTANWQADYDGNLLVYTDAGERPALIHIYHSRRKGRTADTLETYPPENSASPATLTRVLNRVREYRPAASYGLVVLSHATGWLPADMSLPAPALRSVIMDRTAGEAKNYMELSDFAEAIPYRLDFIIFDACFMGAVEVAYELKDKTDRLVASPAEALAPGFVYASMMKHLFAPTPDLASVAHDFYEYHDSRNGLFRSATVSVIKTSALEEVATLFRQAINQEPTQSVSGSLSQVQLFGYGGQRIYFDLGDYIQKQYPEHHAAFQTALDRCVEYKASTSSYYSEGVGTLKVIRSFSGLSVYAPQPAYPEANAAYRKLKWGKL